MSDPRKTSQQPPPLRGIRVMDYSHFLAGPYLSRCLAALGADVIKIERPTQGDAGRTHPYLTRGQSGYFLQQNTGKRGLCVNAKDSRGRELLLRLVSQSDVFVENYRPGTLSKLGLGYTELSRAHPALIYCSVSAFGQSGPRAGKAGFGLIAEAFSGAMDLLGVPEEMPPLFRMPVADMYTGSHGVAAVCAALLSRHTSGRGQHIDMALYDCMLSMHDFATQTYLLSGGQQVIRRSGYTLPQSTVYGVFAANDGALVIAAQADDAWQRLARVIGGERLAQDPRLLSLPGRNAHGEEVIRLVSAWTGPRCVQECIGILEGADVPCAPVRRIDQALADPAVRERGLLVEQRHPVLGDIQLTNVPFKFSAFETRPTRPAPLLGQHNREIAASLGYSNGAMDELERDGVLYCEEAVRSNPVPIPE